MNRRTSSFSQKALSVFLSATLVLSSTPISQSYADEPEQSSQSDAVETEIASESDNSTSETFEPEIISNNDEEDVPATTEEEPSEPLMTFTSIQVELIWQSENPDTEPEKQPITLNLYENGEKTDETLVLDGNPDSEEPSIRESSEWVALFSDLPEHSDVSPYEQIDYTLKIDENAIDSERFKVEYVSIDPNGQETIIDAAKDGCIIRITQLQTEDKDEASSSAPDDAKDTQASDSTENEKDPDSPDSDDQTEPDDSANSVESDSKDEEELEEADDSEQSTESDEKAANEGDSLDEQSDENSSNASDFNYETSSDGTITITGYSGEDVDLVIPSKIDGITVSKIGYGAFIDCDSIESVAVPDTVTRIEGDAFYGCDRLSSITLPDGGCTLEYCSFGYCPNLKSVEIPASATATGAPFAGSGIESAVLAEGAASVPAYMFDRCKSLSSVSIPRGVTEIGSYAFRECGSLKTIDLPENLHVIGNYAFYRTGLAEITMPSTISSIGTHAFQESAVKFYCIRDTYPVIYAIENEIPFVITSNNSNVNSLFLDKAISGYSADLNSRNSIGYINLTIRYSLKDASSLSVTPSSVDITLPNNISVLDSSIKLDDALVSNYWLSSNGRFLSIPVSKNTGKINLQVRATSQVDFTSYATLNVVENGTRAKETIGIINEPVSVLTIESERSISTASLPLSGIAPASSDITLYIGNNQVGTAKSSKAGSWKTTVEIPNPINGRSYSVRAVCQTDSNSLEQNTKVLYEKDSLKLNKFLLKYNNNIVDFLNSDSTPIAFFSASEFVFEIEFNHPELIDAIFVTSTRNNEKKYLEASFDADSNTFIASGYFDSNDHFYVPGVISLEYSRSDTGTNTTEDFDWQSYSDCLPLESDYKPEVTVNEEGQYETTIDFSQYYPELFDTPVTARLRFTDWKDCPEEIVPMSDIIDFIETDKDIISYFVTTENGKEYEFEVDNSDEKSILMIIKDISNNKYFEVILDDIVDSSSSESVRSTVQSLADTLSTGGTIAGILLDQKDIDQDITELKSEIRSLGLSSSEEKEALKKADNLARDRANFMVMSAAIPLVMVGMGLSGPAAIAVTGMLGIIGASSSFFWNKRSDDITGNSRRITQSKGSSYRMKWVVDPSGTIYDAATKQPLEGVTATAYWIESDGSDDFFDTKPSSSTYGTIWDASEYDQSNPLTTNSDGKYAWDVPEGWWRVKYSKKGYITQWSSWMTVPPIQTGIDSYLKRDISKATISEIGTQKYTGKAIKPTVSVSYNGTALKETTDYKLVYSNNTNPGTATVKIVGQGSYSGTISKTFTISKPSTPRISLTKTTASLSFTRAMKTGKQIKPSVSVTYSGKKLVLGTDYSVSYKNNISAGTASVTITGKGKYQGSITKNFAVVNKFTGWKQISGKWYYSSGTALASGWKSISGSKYYFNQTTKAMMTGVIKVSGKYYYLNSSGAQRTGWQKSGSYWYYFGGSGGSACIGWKKIGSTWYYFKSNGRMATGTLTIDGKKYRFAASGAWIG